MSAEKSTKERKRTAISRRQFLTSGAAVVAGTLAAACQPAPTAAPTTAPAAPAAKATTAPAAPAATKAAATTAPAATTAAATTAPAATTAAAKAGGQLILGNVGDLSNLDPFMMTFNNYPMMENVYDQFARLDNKIQANPGALQEWSASADGKKLTLKTRQGMKFHDGSAVSPEDFVKCIQRAAKSETGGHQYSNWAKLQEVVAKGNDTVEVTLSDTAAYIVPALGLISLIRPGGFETLKNQEGGSGPFKVKEWVPGDYLDLDKFADYWDKGRPLLDRARIKFFQDASAMVSALEGGTIDIAMSVPANDYERLKAKVNVVRGQDAANFYALALNTKQAPFDKKEVRQAIHFAVDKATMAKNVLFGIADPIGLPWPKDSLSYFDDLAAKYKYDLDEAKRRLAAAGATNVSFTIPVSNSYPELAKFGEILKASLAQIGVTCNIEPMDGAQWTPIVANGTYQALLTFAGGTQWYPTRISLGSFFRLVNNTCWPNGTPPKGWVDGITKADASLVPAVQKEGMRQAAEALLDEAWVVPIAFRYTLFGLQKHVQNFGFGVYDQPRLFGASSNK